MYNEINIGDSRILPSPKVETPNTSIQGGFQAVNEVETEDFEIHEEVEESLSLENREKELIQKALDKHKGRRKNAADELGISERTLYRKIKEYEING
jgi:transcriptional regulator with PAS, ATPase and Fis domain